VRGSCVSNISKLPSADVSSDRADNDEDDEAAVDEDAMEVTAEADTAADKS
jgi:hypothetical protein